MMLHPRQVAKGLYYGTRWRLKKLLQIPDRDHTPVMSGDLEGAYERHLRICNLLNSTFTPQHLALGFVACEIGSGDCLAGADFFLGSGARKVYLVEKQAILADEKQLSLLKRLAGNEHLPNRVEAIEAGPPPRLNNEKVVIISDFFEDAQLPESVDIIFSFDVLEHVEDFAKFFQSCASILKPGGRMIHKFDLSGHEYFEDPLPPLDFQTYPNWLYNWMFPKYRRATRSFLDEQLTAIRDAGFSEPKVEILHAADRVYTRNRHSQLRSEARKRSLEELTPLDIVVQTQLA